MTPYCNRFLFALCLVYAAVFSSAIYDPSVATTKPPERRESVLPWHSADKGKDSRIQVEPGSPIWQQARDDASTKPATKGWSPWRKIPGSELEQRTQLDIQDHVPEQVSEQVTEQQRNFEFDQQEQQQEDLKPPFGHGKLTDSDKNRERFGDESRYGGNRGWPQNTIDFEHKHPSRSGDAEQTHLEFQSEDLYEGLSADSTKPRKENIPYSRKTQHKVARYDSQFGIQCPEHNSTGQFVYPPDCKFYVNCWKGRAFVEPCTPGTHFNPDTLECDFPHKVKCYEETSADFKEPSSESQVNIKFQKLQQTPQCPPYLTGLLPYPGDCTKFLQCANGITYVTDCGPGTVFNPNNGVCDWPYNVKGCEVTFKSDETPPVPPNTYGQYKSEYTAVKRITCPPDFTGLLPHPETCKKFLQCANGATYIMDCGPGTAFNPITMVCDWPYNVPGCETDKSVDTRHKTGDSTWSSSGKVEGAATWLNTGRYNHTTDSRGFQPLGYGTTISPIFKPTWKPLTTTASPRWIPTWTSARPSYDHSAHATNYHDHYGRVHDNSRYQDNGPYRSEWDSSGGNVKNIANDNSNYGFHGHSERQWVESQKNDRQKPIYIDRPEKPWSYEDKYEDRQREHGRYPPGYHFHHHHHHYHHYHPPIPDSASNPSWDSDSASTDDQRYEKYPSKTDDRHWHVDHDHDFRQHDHRFQYPAPDDQRQYQPHVPSERFDDDNVQFQDKTHNKTKFDIDGNLPANRRTGHDFFPNRQDYSETTPGVHRPTFNRTSSSAENIFPNSGDKFAGDRDKVRNESQDRLPAPWAEQESTAWSQPADFKPSTWLGQSSQEETHSTRDQGANTREDDFDQWQSGSDIYQQSSVDRETGAKAEQWKSKTNVLLNSRSEVGTESKNETQYPKTNLYPNGIYVDANGLKGHYITEEIENNPGRSKNNSYGDRRLWNIISNNTGNNYTPFFYNVRTTTPAAETTKKIPNRQSELSRRGKTLVNTAPTKEPLNSFGNKNEFNLPGVSTELDDYSNRSDMKISNTNPESPDVVEPEINDYDVDVLDDKNVWKPRLVFENKTETTTAPSVIMKIGPKKTDVEVFNIEAAPFQEEDPAFPTYYIQPVRPLDHSEKLTNPTPISGQTVRLRGGSGPHDGYVEVQGLMPGWGTVCDSRNSWTLKEANIVCRQLGYTRGAEMAWQGRNNRDGMPTWIAANTVTCLGNETRFQSCKFTHNQECRVNRDAIGVRCASNRIAHCHKDEIPHNGQCYHLADPDSGLNHAEALEHCTRRNARLIDITSQAENNFVSEWLSQSYPEVSSIMTSGVGFTTMNHALWVWEDSARAKFKFTKWWPGWMNDTRQPPWVGSRPLCIVMSRRFPCHERPESRCLVDYFFWDTEDCSTSSKGHSFVCKRPYNDIGCVYGKGNQYTGQANITLSGKECIPWADERISPQLHLNVFNKEVRDRLRMHNYCRNPNPAKESRPWCFVEPKGQREYCDIPACGNIEPKRSMLTGQCKPKHFECSPGECIPSPWVCDGEEDCTNGADERTCTVDLGLFEKSAKHKLDGYDVEKWLNTPLKTCALRCKEADFTCRSFNHKSEGNICLLSDNNIGSTGALKPDEQFDYYELKERSVNCDGMYVCNNGKCVNQSQICNGKNDCNDRSDESICTAENLDYGIRLAGADNNYEGRVEVRILGHWGQVCDDGFGMINADVICRELGFALGALEVRPGGFYGNLDPPTRFMVDQLKCRGNETTLRECDSNGWGVHNCQPEEAVGIVCKTAVNTCQEGHWKCDNSPTCIPTAFICDEVVDCPDRSDESPEHCDAPFELRLANGSSPLQGRVEVRHHGIWGTMCDDDFTNATAKVICRSLGYGGIAIAKKNGFFGPGQGPIWLDEVFCHGNESQLYRCEHSHWGQHNCDHNEDAGVICSVGDINDSEPYWEKAPGIPEQSIDELLPSNCGKRAKDFNEDEDFIFAKVVHGSVAPRGTYPWQASIRVRGHSRSNHWCGAVVISPLHVLTAAHCLEGYNKATYFVRAGDYNTDIDEGTEAEANIEDYYVHEEFRKGHRMNNDIALVLLKGHGIPLGKDIMPICLPSENTEYSPGLNCTISGFGSIETGKTTQSKDLRYGWVPLLDQSICRADYVYGEGAIREGMMCAGYLDEGIDTCDGDSGGPLACYHNGAFTLYGITSWGQHCGKANKPGVYVHVAYYRRWIDKKIRESLTGR